MWPLSVWIAILCFGRMLLELCFEVFFFWKGQLQQCFPPPGLESGSLWVRAEYPDQLDYSGDEFSHRMFFKESSSSFILRPTSSKRRSFLFCARCACGTACSEGCKWRLWGTNPRPLRNGALSHRLRPLGQTVLEGQCSCSIMSNQPHLIHAQVFCLKRKRKPQRTGQNMRKWRRPAITMVTSGKLCTSKISWVEKLYRSVMLIRKLLLRASSNSAAGNWTRVFRVTGGNTDHYTTADLSKRFRIDIH